MYASIRAWQWSLVRHALHFAECGIIRAENSENLLCCPDTNLSLSLSFSLSLCTLNLPLFISGTAILDSRIARRSCYLRRIVNFSSASAFFATCVSWIESLGTNKYAYNVADGRDASLDDFSNSKIERFLDKRQMRRLLRSYLTSNVDYFYHVRRQWRNVSVRIEN